CIDPREQEAISDRDVQLLLNPRQHRKSLRLHHVSKLGVTLHGRKLTQKVSRNLIDTVIRRGHRVHTDVDETDVALIALNLIEGISQGNILSKPSSSRSCDVGLISRPNLTRDSRHF